MKRKVNVLLALVISLSALVVTKAAATDFLVEIDGIVVSLHDYSVLTGKLNSKLNTADMRAQTSKLNNQLTLIRKNIVLFDKDLSYNWKILIDNDNVNYPHRQLLKEFNNQVFDWFNYELQIQKKSNACLLKKTNEVQCVLAVRSAAKNTELKKYKALTETLTAIQDWRTRYGR